MNLVLLGAPGAGKGTQAERIAKDFEICHISTGDILRKSVAEGTELGKLAKGYMDKGELVPDDVIVSVVAERLKEQDCCGGFLLDGFPRTIAQADALDKALAEGDKELDAVLSVEVSVDELVRRLANRRSCKNCGKVYHLIFNPPKEEQFCDVCHTELYQREDDRQEAIERRFEVYLNQTAPLVDYYRNKGVLKVVNGEESPAKVYEKITEILEAIDDNKKVS